MRQKGAHLEKGECGLLQRRGTPERLGEVEDVLTKCGRPQREKRPERLRVPPFKDISGMGQRPGGADLLSGP